MYSDLNDFIADLDKRGLLARVAEAVSPDLEIAAVTDRVCKSPNGGPALLFERPTGYDMPVATNLYGSNTRMCLALGVNTLDDLAREIDELMTPQMPAGIMDALKMLPMVARLRDLMPKTVKDGACQEIVDRNGTLDALPILKCWPRTAAKHHVPAGIHEGPRHPARATSAPIACRCSTAARPACTGSATRAGHSTTGSPSGWAGGSRSPSRSAPNRCCPTARPRRCPKGSMSQLLGGFLSRKRIEMVRCVTVDLRGAGQRPYRARRLRRAGRAPARGAVRRSHRPLFQPDDFPLFHITCITRRKRPTYLTTVVGVPPMEDYYLGLASAHLPADDSQRRFPRSSTCTSRPRGSSTT
jgi:4-hydroxy-3-polyprenylbenzoate decarboxylase